MPAAPYYDHYPYEKLTDTVTADIARKQDRQITDLRQENQSLKTALYYLTQKWDQLLPLLKEMGIDPDVLIATANTFKGPDNG